MNISKNDFRDGLWCKCYTVCWKDSMTILNIWKQKSFHNIKDAKIFAKKMWKMFKSTKLKPYIIETIVPCKFFRKDLFDELFIVNEERYPYDYARRIK